MIEALISQASAVLAERTPPSKRQELVNAVIDAQNLYDIPEPWRGQITLLVNAHLESVQKFNQNHDKLGRFSSGTGMTSSVAESIIARTKANGGLSVRMVSGREPRGGYMVATSNEYSKIVSEADFFDRKTGIKILAEYAKSQRTRLVDGKFYLGLWHNKGKVSLDVAEHIMDKTKAIEAGQGRNQISIWDVANFVEIQTGGDGVHKQSSIGRDSSRDFDDDGRGNRGLGDEGIRLSGLTRVIKFEAGLIPVLKFNPNHDNLGRFASNGSALTARYLSYHSAYNSSYMGRPDFGADGKGASPDESNALNSYIVNGYRDINPYLRKGLVRGAGGGKASVVPDPEGKVLMETHIASLDSLIARIPQVKSEIPLYRVLSTRVLPELKVGGVFTDKGYMSTTLRDLTAPDSWRARYDLGDLHATTDVLMRIIPNGHYSGVSVNHLATVLSASPSEREFLMPRNSQLRYLGTSAPKDGEKIYNFERMNG